MRLSSFRLVPALVFVLLVSRGWCQIASIQPTLKGKTLITALRKEYRPTTVLNYHDARDRLFAVVNRQAGRTRLIYTPESITASGIPPATVANAEHVWPQSRFAQSPLKGKIKCDLHHLFPCRDEVNSARGNSAFAEIPDDQTTSWWISSSSQDPIPAAAQRPLFSESTGDKFEPREADKGDVARAMFYVFAIYGGDNINMPWFTPQRETLLAWHNQDPADQFELERSQRVEAIQGNQNPFVQDRTLIYRVLNLPVPNAPATAIAEAAIAEKSVAPSEKAAPAKEAASAERIRIVTWNIREVFTVQDVLDRADELKTFAAEMKPDILLLQELTSYEEAVKIRDVMGLSGYFVVCSNFQDDEDTHDSFEVAIISKYPLDDVVEFDQTPDNDPDEPNMPETEKKLIAPHLPGLKNAHVARGYLRARIDELKLIVRVTHLKSSLGKTGLADKSNAQKREIVAAAMAAGVAADEEALPDYTSLVAGDFNVAATDAAKTGAKLTEDEYDASAPGDKYDDTQALLTSGLVRDLKMTNLARSLGKPSFKTGSAANGPIDWILVSGAKRANFSPADRAPWRRGSDHWAVGTYFTAP